MDFESEKLLAAFRGVPHLGTWGGRRKIKSLDGCSIGSLKSVV